MKNIFTTIAPYALGITLLPVFYLCVAPLFRPLLNTPINESVAWVIIPIMYLAYLAIPVVALIIAVIYRKNSIFISHTAIGTFVVTLLYYAYQIFTFQI